VYCWQQPPGVPPPRRRTLAFNQEPFEVSGADVADVRAWAETTAAPDRMDTLYALVDVTAPPGSSGWRGPTRRSRKSDEKA
jgi:hypothetical protein